jgi:hypothetical protein
MYEGRAQTLHTDSTNSHRENYSAGGILAYLLAAPALIAVLSAPAIAFGVVVGAVGLALGRRVVRRFRQRGSGEELPAPDPEGRPA